MLQKLKTIKELKEINNGQSVSEESLRLLHWLANIVDIDDNNVIWLTFDPGNQDFGSHQYHNFEGLLDPLPQGQKYYTIGDLDAGGAEELPDYVINRMDNTRRNMARIIIRVREESRGTTVHQVYVTQHYNISENKGSRYDPEHTYHVTTKLLRQIREFSLEYSHSMTEIRNIFGSEIDDSQLEEIKNTWGELAPLGLLLIILLPKRNIGRYSNTSNTPTDVAVEMLENDNASNNDCKRNVCIGLGVCFSILVISIIIIVCLLIGRRKK